MARSVVKFLPSIAYTLISLGMVFTWSCFHGSRASGRTPFTHWVWRPLLAFGRTPLFFYVLHI